MWDERSLSRARGGTSEAYLHYEGISMAEETAASFPILTAKDTHELQKGAQA